MKHVSKSTRQKPTVYDFFAVPLRDGSFGLGQFIGTGDYDEKICVLYRTRESSLDSLRDRVRDLGTDDIIGMARVSSPDLERGNWTVVENQEPMRRAYLSSLTVTNKVMYTGEIIDGFLDAFHRLRSWYDSPAGPRWYRAILVPHLQPPPECLTERLPSIGHATPSKPAAQHVPSGPGEVHVTIRYDGEDLPDMESLRKRQSIEEWIESERLGEVTDAGGGGGVMDIYIETTDAPKAVAALRIKLEEIGWRSHSNIEVDPEHGSN
jgi:hypothetical protein